jgi:hypothetical protein
LWITAYGAISYTSALEVARQVTATVFPSLAASALAPAWGLVIHFGLSVMLAMAFAATVLAPMEERFGRYGTLLGAVALLSTVWAVNFLLVLPVLNPGFVTLLPIPVTLISKILFALAMAGVLRHPLAANRSIQALDHEALRLSDRTGIAGFQPRRIRRLPRVFTDVPEIVLVCMLLLASALHANVALAADDSTRQSHIVDGIAVYLGVIPAEILKGHPAGHVEREMHRTSVPGPLSQHVLIALFDSTSGARITDATVEAAVLATGLPAKRVALEPMTIGDSVTFGNFMPLPARVPYRIQVWIRRPIAARELMVEFAL